MKVTFNGGVVEKGRLFEAGQTVDISDELYKHIKENTPEGTVVPAGAETPVTTTEEKPVQAPKAPPAPQNPGAPEAPKE